MNPVAALHHAGVPTGGAILVVVVTIIGLLILLDAVLKELQ